VLSLDVKGIGVVQKAADGRCLLQVFPAYTDGLSGLKFGDQVQVLYWMHELSHADRRLLRVHPRGDMSKPLLGVFGLRSPMRPNPIGVTEVKVIEVRESAIVVVGLDAKDGSPLIDIKAACPIR
jgi:L-fuculose-phosphate aldolase